MNASIGKGNKTFLESNTIHVKRCSSSGTPCRRAWVSKFRCLRVSSSHEPSSTSTSRRNWICTYTGHTGTHNRTGETSLLFLSSNASFVIHSAFVFVENRVFVLISEEICWYTERPREKLLSQHPKGHCGHWSKGTSWILKRTASTLFRNSFSRLRNSEGRHNYENFVPIRSESRFTKRSKYFTR